MPQPGQSWSAGFILRQRGRDDLVAEAEASYGVRGSTFPPKSADGSRSIRASPKRPGVRSGSPIAEPGRQHRSEQGQFLDVIALAEFANRWMGSSDGRAVISDAPAFSLPREEAQN